MNATIRVLPLVRNLVAIMADRALGRDWKEHPTFGVEGDSDHLARKYQDQLRQLKTALAEIDTPHDAALGLDEAINRAPAGFEDAHRRLKGVLEWLMEQGFSVMAYSVGVEGFPIVQIAYSESARRELRMVGAGCKTDAEGRKFTRFSAQRNGVRIWWEREEGRFSFKKKA
ncbi:MAG: hypothetical protein PHU46_11620 [Rhodocyclaceae bacterium]|nr:hypothetical protein [Rhodocyclaceae bacterium]